MKVVAFDPSMRVTGAACVSEGGARLVDTVLIMVPDKGDAMDRCSSLFADAASYLADMDPDVIVVETPAEKGRHPDAWGYSGRSALSMPVYGMAVGVVMAAAIAHTKARTGRAIRLLNRPADSWTKGMPGTKADKNKTARVRLACTLFGLAPDALGAETNAGNAADAILLARHMAQMLGAETWIPGGGAR